MPADIPFGFGPSGGDVPDPNDPQQVQRFLSQLQQLFATPGGGPVNWDLARQVAQGHLTGGAAATRSRPPPPAPPPPPPPQPRPPPSPPPRPATAARSAPRRSTRPNARPSWRRSA